MNTIFASITVICLSMVMRFTIAPESHAKKRIVFGWAC